MTTDPIPVIVGTGRHYEHTVWLGEGNNIGHIDVLFWSRGGIDSAESESRNLELTARIAALVGSDAECQRILSAEAAELASIKGRKDD